MPGMSEWEDLATTWPGAPLGGAWGPQQSTAPHRVIMWGLRGFAVVMAKCVKARGPRAFVSSDVVLLAHTPIQVVCADAELIHR